MRERCWRRWHARSPRARGRGRDEQRPEHDERAGSADERAPADGAARYEIPLGAALPHFSSLSLAGGIAYVSTLDGVTAVSGA